MNRHVTQSSHLTTTCIKLFDTKSVTSEAIGYLGYCAMLCYHAPYNQLPSELNYILNAVVNLVLLYSSLGASSSLTTHRDKAGNHGDTITTDSQ